MFNSLRLKNFRAFRDSGSLPLRPLTVVVGPNNSGKSTLLNSLFLLKQTLGDPTRSDALVTSGSVDLGSFDDIVRGGDRSRHLGIELSVPDVVLQKWLEEGPPRAESDAPLRVGDRLSAEFFFDDEANAVRVAKAQFRQGAKTVLAARWSEEQKKYVITHPKRSRTAPASMSAFVPSLGIPDEAPEDPRERFRSISESIDTIHQSTRWGAIIGGIDHVAPLRLPIPRVAILGRTTPSDLSAGGETLLQLLRAGGGTQGTRNERLIEAINHWMSERFGMLKELRLVDVDRAGRVLTLLADEPRGLRGINIANMGEGLSQLLPIVASTLITPPGGCLLVEQPELHLHPAAQAALGDVFVEALNGLEGPQFIVETHSEHFVLRLRRRIAEERLSADAVSFLYVEKPRAEAHVRKLELDQSGHFTEWPDGFFEEGYREALHLAEAASKHQ